MEPDSPPPLEPFSVFEDASTNGIAMDQQSPMYSFGRQATRLLPRPLKVVQRDPSSVERRSQFVTEYLCKKAYASNNERVVVVSEEWPDIHRVVGQMIVSAESGNFAIYDLARNVCLLQATPYSVTKCDADGKPEFTLGYVKQPYVIHNSVKDPPDMWELTNDSYDSRISMAEMRLFDFIPYDILVSWLPDEAYDETIVVVGREHRKSEDVITRNSWEFVTTIAREQPAICPFVVQVGFREHHNQNLEYLEEDSNLMDFIKWAAQRSWCVASFSARPRVDKHNKSYATPIGHAICVYVEHEVVYADTVVTSNIMRFKIFDPNGRWQTSELIHEAILETFKNVTTDIKPEVYLSNVNIQSRLERRLNGKSAHAKNVYLARCVTWTALLMMNLVRFHGLLEPERVVREFMRLTPEAAYHVMTMFALYMDGIVNDTINRPQTIVVKSEPVSSPMNRDEPIEIDEKTNYRSPYALRPRR